MTPPTTPPTKARRSCPGAPLKKRRTTDAWMIFPMDEQPDEEQRNRRELDRRQLARRELDRRQLARRELGGRELDRRQLGGRELDRRQLGGRDLDRRQLGGSERDRRQLGGRELDRRQLDEGFRTPERPIRHRVPYTPISHFEIAFKVQ